VSDDRPATLDDRDQVLVLIGDYLDQLAVQAHRGLGDVAGVAVTMADGAGHPLTVGASTDLARAVDRVQYEIGHGPCLHALRGGGGDYVPSLARDDRWGTYGPQAAALGAVSCVSVPVESGSAVLAVFKVYSGVEDGLDEEQRRAAVETAREVAGGIGLALTLVSTTAELSDRVKAMDSRRTIDLALGMLMERTGCTADDAFALLRRYSQTRNLKLRDVAAELIDPTGDRAGSGAPFARAEPTAP
jgi:hypothetical protein